MNTGTKKQKQYSKHRPKLVFFSASSVTIRWMCMCVCAQLQYNYTFKETTGKRKEAMSNEEIKLEYLDNNKTHCFLNCFSFLFLYLIFRLALPFLRFFGAICYLISKTMEPVRSASMRARVALYAHYFERANWKKLLVWSMRMLYQHSLRLLLFTRLSRECHITHRDKDGERGLNRKRLRQRYGRRLIESDEEWETETESDSSAFSSIERFDAPCSSMPHMVAVHHLIVLLLIKLTVKHNLWSTFCPHCSCRRRRCCRVNVIIVCSMIHCASYVCFKT